MNRVIKASVELACRNSRHCEVISSRRCTTTTTKTTTSPPPPPTAPPKPPQSSSTVKADVPGLSKSTVDVPASEVGFPGASKKATYKNPEYFCYHNVSFFQAEVEMKKYRLPQPSNKKK